MVFRYFLGKKNFVAQHMLSSDDTNSTSLAATEVLNLQTGRGRNVNRYNLKFHVETKEEIEARKELARQAIVPEPETGLEHGTDFCFVPGLEFPQRPNWDYKLTQQMLVSIYLNNLKSNVNTLSHFLESF